MSKETSGDIPVIFYGIYDFPTIEFVSANRDLFNWGNSVGCHIIPEYIAIWRPKQILFLPGKLSVYVH